MSDRVELRLGQGVDFVPYLLAHALPRDVFLSQRFVFLKYFERAIKRSLIHNCHESSRNRLSSKIGTTDYSRFT